MDLTLKIDEVMLRRIKWSTVALGVRNYTMPDVDIVGTGFFYDTRGYLFSAGHVLRGLRKIQLDNELKNQKSEIIAMNMNVSKINDRAAIILDGDKIELKDILLPKIPTTINEPTAPAIPDFGIAKIQPSREKYPFLKIRKEFPPESPFRIGEDIVLCGYPAGEQSLSLRVSANQGLRFSPVMQFGHIGALLPTDDSIPYGIQTDILSTGGSSGSPIVSLETGEVIAIAQKIIVTPTGTDIPQKAQKKARLPKILYGFAHIGIVWGDACTMFADVVDMTSKDFSGGVMGSSRAVFTSGGSRSEFMGTGITISQNEL